VNGVLGYTKYDCFLLGGYWCEALNMCERTWDRLQDSCPTSSPALPVDPSSSSMDSNSDSSRGSNDQNSDENSEDGNYNDSMHDTMQEPGLQAIIKDDIMLEQNNLGPVPVRNFADLCPPDICSWLLDHSEEVSSIDCSCLGMKWHHGRAELQG